MCYVMIMEKNASKTNYKLDCICEIQTATTTFIACSTRFRLISHPFENLSRIPTGPWGFIIVPIPIRMGIRSPANLAQVR